MGYTGAEIKTAVKEHISLLRIFKGFIVSYIITIPLFVVFALVLTYTNFPERLISPAVVVTTLISIVVAGSTATRQLRSKGWLNGGLVGFMYMLILYIFSSLTFNNYSLDNYVITMGIIGVLTGSVGGIIGINMRKSGVPRSRTTAR